MQSDVTRLGNVEPLGPRNPRAALHENSCARLDAGLRLPLCKLVLVEPQEDPLAEHFDRRVGGEPPPLRSEVGSDPVGLRAVAPESTQSAHLAYPVHLSDTGDAADEILRS